MVRPGRGVVSGRGSVQGGHMGGGGIGRVIIREL